MSSKNGSLSSQTLLDSYFSSNGIEPFSEYPVDEELFGVLIRNSPADLEYMNEELNKQDWFNSEEPIMNDALFEGIKALSDNDFQKELEKHTFYSEENAKKYVDFLKKQGYEFLEGSVGEDGDYYFNLKLGNQLISISSNLIKDSSRGNYTMYPSEIFQHISNELPSIYKFYPGKIKIGGFGGGEIGPDGKITGMTGGSYNHDTNEVLINNNAFTIGSDFKGTLEHELTHRLDNFGGMYKEGWIGTNRISDHPMFKIASEAFPSSTYSQSYDGVSPYPYNYSIKRIESLAEATAPLGTALSTTKTSYSKNTSPDKTNYELSTQRTTMGEETSYRDYQMINPYMDYVGNYVHNAKSPKQIINFLNNEYATYRRNNPEIFERYGK